MTFRIADDSEKTYEIDLNFVHSVDTTSDLVFDSIEIQSEYAKELGLVDTAPVPEILKNHPSLNWLDHETITVTQLLTEQERSNYAGEMAKLDGEIEELEAERDATSKRLKKKIDAMDMERRTMSKIVREGNQTHEISCDKVADYDSCEIKWSDAVTGEVVRSRPMTTEERQLPLTMNGLASSEQDETEEADPVESAPVDFDELQEGTASASCLSPEECDDMKESMQEAADELGFVVAQTDEPQPSAVQ